MGKSSKEYKSHERSFKINQEEFPTYIYSASAHHSMVMDLIKKAQMLEYKIKNIETDKNQRIEIAYKRLEKASEIYRKVDELMYFGDYRRIFSMKEIEEVYNGLKRTTIYDYEPLCFIRE